MTRVTFPQLRDPEWLRRRYVDDGASTRVIANEIGCSMRGVLGALARYQIPVRRSGPRRALADLTADEALKLAREHGMSGAARELGVAPGTFDFAVAALGIAAEANVAARAYRSQVMPREWWWPRELCDPRVLADLYDRTSAVQIADMLQVHRTTVTAALEAHGIRRRRGNERPPLALARGGR